MSTEIFLRLPEWSPGMINRKSHKKNHWKTSLWARRQPLQHENNNKFPSKSTAQWIVGARQSYIRCFRFVMISRKRKDTRVMKYYYYFFFLGARARGESRYGRPDCTSVWYSVVYENLGCVKGRRNNRHLIISLIFSFILSESVMLRQPLLTFSTLLCTL